MKFDHVHTIIAIRWLRIARICLGGVDATLQVKHRLVFIEGEDLLFPNALEHVLIKNSIRKRIIASGMPLLVEIWNTEHSIALHVRNLHL